MRNLSRVLSLLSMSGSLAVLSLNPLSSLVQADEVRFERIQLSNEFYSEGGTHGDLDGDGHGEVIVGPWIYWGPTYEKKTRFYEGPAIDPVGYSENFLMYTDDVDADGRRDILVMGFPGKESWWYRNPGKGETEKLWPRHTMLMSVDNESPMIGDINGDGIQDLICSSGGHYGFGSHAGAKPTDLWSFRKISPNNGYQRFTHGIGIGDVDNDGLTDLLEKDGWWKNPGNDAPADKLWDFKPHAFSAGGGSQMFAIDLDGDGKNEVLTGLAAHGFGLAYYKATNAEATQFEKVDIMTNSAETSPVGMAVSQLHAVALGDMNGDGITDIITGKRWWAHANHDDGHSQPAVLMWLECQRSNGRVNFIPHVIDISSGVGTQITVGDVNADGLLDIVSGTKRGAHLFLQRPATLPSDKPMVPGLAASDPFHQRPAKAFARIEDELGGIRPALSPAQPLNLDFEAGNLNDWEARGPITKTLLVNGADAKAAQAVAGVGKFWVHTGEDKAFGELISRPFTLNHKSASFLIGGSDHPEARVELVSESSGQVLRSAHGNGSDDLRRVTLDISPWQGELVRIRVVDHANDAHLLFDDFRLHD
jgi:hypothetical protein